MSRDLSPLPSVAPSPHMRPEEEPLTPGGTSPVPPAGANRSRGLACAGIAVLGCVILAALILVAVKQSQSVEEPRSQQVYGVRDPPSLEWITKHWIVLQDCTRQHRKDCGLLLRATDVPVPLTPQEYNNKLNLLHKSYTAISSGGHNSDSRLLDALSMLHQLLEYDKDPVLYYVTLSTASTYTPPVTYSTSTLSSTASQAAYTTSHAYTTPPAYTTSQESYTTSPPGYTTSEASYDYSRTTTTSTGRYTPANTGAYTSTSTSYTSQTRAPTSAAYTSPTTVTPNYTVVGYVNLGQLEQLWNLAYDCQSHADQSLCERLQQLKNKTILEAEARQLQGGASVYELVEELQDINRTIYDTNTNTGSDRRQVKAMLAEMLEIAKTMADNTEGSNLDTVDQLMEHLEALNAAYQDTQDDSALAEELKKVADIVASLESQGYNVGFKKFHQILEDLSRFGVRVETETPTPRRHIFEDDVEEEKEREEEEEDHLLGSECGPSELSCRNGEGCYSKTQHCNNEVDCEDFSDETVCTCRDRLQQERLCDSYPDCPNGEDEEDCGCEGGHFFCFHSERDFDTSICVNRNQVCDGKIDCVKEKDEHDDDDFFYGHGRDEADCLILGPVGQGLDLSRAGQQGYLHLKRENYTYRPVAVAATVGDDFLRQLATFACQGLELRPPPIYSLSPAPEFLQVVKLAEDWGAEEGQGHLLSLVTVDCGQLSCNKLHRRNRSDTFDAECAGKIVAGGKLLANKEDDDEFVCGPIDASNSIHSSIVEYTGEDDISGVLKASLQLENGDRPVPCNKEAFAHWKQDNGVLYNDICNVDGTEEKIVGGKVARPDKWPSAVSLYRNSVFICGATLVSEGSATDLLLTAAHCVHDITEQEQEEEEEEDEALYTVRAGMLRKASHAPWEQHRTVVAVTLHPEFENIFLSHDLAVLRLNASLAVNRHVQPSCLPQDISMFPEVGSTCVATGWGDLSENGPSAKELMQGLVPIRPNCTRSYNQMEFQICGGYVEGGKDSCQGDSGGPLYCPSQEDFYYLAGVISHGKGCAKADEAGVYVRLSYYVGSDQWLAGVLSGDISFNESTPLLSCGGKHCASGECIPLNYICDKQVLGEGSDRMDLCRVKSRPRLLQVDCSDGGDIMGCSRLENGTVVVETAASEHNNFDYGDFTNVFDLSNFQCGDDKWQCLHLPQCVDASKRCDNVVGDCIDGTDEWECRCGERVQPGLLCDGVADCRDSSDEERCGHCLDKQWFCPLSLENSRGREPQCIRESLRCRQTSSCSWGEDTRYCAALAKDHVLRVQAGDLPVLQSKGTLVVFERDVWGPVCTTSFNKKLLNNLCQYMGWPQGSSFSLIDKETDINITRAEMRSSQCSHVSLTCLSSVCGTRPLYRGLPSPVPWSAGGSVPWQATLFTDGEFVCGGSLVGADLLLTDIACAQQCRERGGYIAVLVGQDRRTTVGLSPGAQVRRLVSLRPVSGSALVLGQLEAPFELSERVTPLCLPSIDWRVGAGACIISGATEERWTSVVETSRPFPCGSGMLCTEQMATNTSTRDWSGVLVCPDSSGRFAALGSFYSGASSPPTEFTSLLPLISQLEAMVQRSSVKKPVGAEVPCSGVWCGLGVCVTEEQVCDGTWQCPEGEDERGCVHHNMTSLAPCEAVGGGRCVCPQHQGKCGNNQCLPRQLYCDGDNNCGDNSDENNCNDCGTQTEFFTPKKLCDGISDCSDSGDEAAIFCPHCGDDRDFRCDVASLSKTPTCVSSRALCDGTNDCLSGADEKPRMCLGLGAGGQVVEQDKLHVPTNAWQGILQVRLSGRWFPYCTHTWSEQHSTAMCWSLGFMKGARDWSLVHPTEVDFSMLTTKTKSCRLLKLVCIRGE